ncbi:hypothetical protein sr11575 [Sporisorium reilianum SRZ2]|uniref:Uncharacterized protein n=1 Tax=Sporisorium reilianum (strain SRZ2) TaxID=999809 RepID=E6ZJX2_SPORE|nr:hypothetical protein sr11575 [Sporisorium reilianum SRZ2]
MSTMRSLLDLLLQHIFQIILAEVIVGLMTRKTSSDREVKRPGTPVRDDDEAEGMALFDQALHDVGLTYKDIIDAGEGWLSQRFAVADRSEGHASSASAPPAISSSASTSAPAIVPWTGVEPAPTHALRLEDLNSPAAFARYHKSTPRGRRLSFVGRIKLIRGLPFVFALQVSSQQSILVDIKKGAWFYDDDEFAKLKEGDLVCLLGVLRSKWSTSFCLGFDDKSVLQRFDRWTSFDDVVGINNRLDRLIYGQQFAVCEYSAEDVDSDDDTRSTGAESDAGTDAEFRRACREIVLH